MPSLARTILEEHLERGELAPGHEIALRVDQTLAHGGSVLALRHLQELEPVEGIGALLRY